MILLLGYGILTCIYLELLCLSSFETVLGTDGQTNRKFRFKEVVKTRPHNLFMFILFHLSLPSVSLHVHSFKALFFSCMLGRIQSCSRDRNQEDEGGKEGWEWWCILGMSKWVCHHSITQGEESDCDLVYSSCIFYSSFQSSLQRAVRKEQAGANKLLLRPAELLADLK